MMKKRLLSIFTSVSLVASALAISASAAPALAGSQDTATEYFPEPLQIVEKAPSDVTLSGPSAVLVQDTASESNTEFGTPALLEGALLMDALSGEGTEESPYLITNSDDLFLFAHNINSGINNNAYYKLTADIDLGGAEWAPIGHYTELNKHTVSFCGVFDGDGHTVSNFKITKEDTYYVGLFGLVANGTVKNVNVDSANIDLDYSSSQTVYAGGVVGRLVTTVQNGYASVTNCNVSDVSINANNLGSIYAGGISGSVVSGPKDDNGNYKKASIFIAFSTVDNVNINITSEAKYHPTPAPGKPTKPHTLRSGGFAGYISSLPESTTTVINCSANANVVSDARNSSVTQAMSGGMFADAWAYDKETGLNGKMTINSCYSDGTATARSDYYPYVVGGFSAQFYPSQHLYVNDCYSSCDAYGEFLQAGGGDGNDPTAGGFVGQYMFDNYVLSYGKLIKNCYASGDVKDLTHTDSTPKDYSFVGGFMGWSTAGVFENCYRLESQTVIGSDLNYADNNNITVLSEQEAKYIDKYVGFDMSKTWQMNPEAEYGYPTLREKLGYANFVFDGVSFATDVFGTDGKVSAPSEEPEKSMTVDKVYTFNYWSLSENGAPFNFGGETISEDTTFYAVFKSSPRPYTIRFVNEGKNFSTSSLGYGTAVKAPIGTPEKADEEFFYFTFSHWSDTENGTAFDFSDYTVVGDKTFYAVYNFVDKRAWTGSVAEEFSSGFGTQTLPYVIKSADEFALFAKVINEQQAGYTDAYYALGNDINLGNNYWTPIGNSNSTPFSANFDGRGYTISNFKMASGQYGGLFGVVANATIKNVAISGYEFKYSFSSSTKNYPAFAGVLAGYVKGERGTVEISGVRISDGEFNISAGVHEMYVGNIAGYAIALTRGKVNIHDCYATNAITVENTAGYAYAGGIVGKLHTGSGSPAKITRCYNTGKVSSTSYYSSRAGGLVGYLWSFGTDYVSTDKEGFSDALLSATTDDIDIMIEDSFAAAEIYSYAIGGAPGATSSSYAGLIAAECNVYASVANTYYPSNINIPVVAVKNPQIDTSGTAVPKSIFTNEELLSEACGFDFENTWTYDDSFDYPVFKYMVSDKPVLKLVSALYENKSLDTMVRVVCPEEDFTVIVGVYNARNQLIAVKRVSFTDSANSIVEFKADFDNVKNAEFIKLSAVEKSSLLPLFESVTTQL